MIPVDFLRDRAAKLGIALTDRSLQQLDRYAELLVEWNEKMNLTGITDPEGIAVRHFLDSLTLLADAQIPAGGRLIDVGTGAGFPGVVVKIARPDLDVTLLDSLNKRLIFLQAVSDAIELPMTIIHGRAEESARTALRERFDCATARAVAALPVLAEYCIPFVKKGGLFVAMKGPDCGAECAEAAGAIRMLGGKTEQTVTHTLPDGSGRTLILIRKTGNTPAAYPRAGAKIAKAPLGAKSK